ncbi:hypothetical protein DFH09DRAFT_1291216 [Mycena vulgaris]|nr:hypothetical protein DFH09DRAFT_1291216 [Mycena vulgaris]
MALHPSISRIRLKNTVDGVTAAVTTVEQLSNAFDTPFLAPISTITRSILISLQTVKQNMDQCAQLTEQIHQLLYAIIGLHINSGASGELAPSMLHNLGKFTETLNKVNVFVEAQQGRSIIKQFFRKGEMTTLLRDCKVGLQQALEDFKVQGFNLLSDAADMERHAQKIHEEVLELIVSLSDGTNSDWASSMNRVLSTAQNSSNSISMLPSQPKIFHGRESQISDILKALIQESPRIAILGAGGMGKTSLARAVLHHTEISSRYERHRFFVACDTVSTSVELAGLIGAHLGLKPGKDLTKAITKSGRTCQGAPKAVARGSRPLEGNLSRGTCHKEILRGYRNDTIVGLRGAMSGLLTRIACGWGLTRSEWDAGFSLQLQDEGGCPASLPQHMFYASKSSGKFRKSPSHVIYVLILDFKGFWVPLDREWNGPRISEDDT